MKCRRQNKSELMGRASNKQPTVPLEIGSLEIIIVSLDNCPTVANFTAKIGPVIKIQEVRLWQSGIPLTRWKPFDEKLIGLLKASASGNNPGGKSRFFPGEGRGAIP
jgi:hypothetical protein